MGFPTELYLIIFNTKWCCDR